MRSRYDGADEEKTTRRGPRVRARSTGREGKQTCTTRIRQPDAVARRVVQRVTQQHAAAGMVAAGSAAARLFIDSSAEQREIRVINVRGRALVRYARSTVQGQCQGTARACRRVCVRAAAAYVIRSCLHEPKRPPK